MMFGGFEWLLIVVVLLLLFGAKHIPKMVRGIGQGILEFRKTTNELNKERQENES